MASQVVTASPREFDRRRTIRLVMIAAAVIIVLALAYAVTKKVISPTSARSLRTINTTGVGKKTVNVQKVVVTLTVSEEGQNRTQLIETGNTIMANALTTFEGSNVSSQTTNEYTIVPQVNRLTGKEESLRYIASAQVTLENPQGLSTLLNSLYQKDVFLVQVTYVPQNEEDLKKEIRDMAIEDAASKADQLSDKAGANIGKVVSISEPLGAKPLAIKLPSQNPTILQVEFSTTVNVTYELK
jgi:uncharacterized protein YggE